MEMEHIRTANELYPEQKSKPVAPEWVTRATGNEAYGGAPALEQESNVHPELETTRIAANPTPKKAQPMGSRGGTARNKNEFTAGEQQKQRTMASATKQIPTGVQQTTKNPARGDARRGAVARDKSNERGAPETQTP